LAVPLSLLDLVVPIHVVHLHQRLPALDGGVGNDDVDFAVLVLDLIGDLTKNAAVPDVGLDGRCAPSVLPDTVDRLGELRLGGRHGVGRRTHRPCDIYRDDICTVGGKFGGDRAANAPRRSSHDGDLSGKRGSPAGLDRAGRSIWRWDRVESSDRLCDGMATGRCGTRNTAADRIGARGLRCVADLCAHAHGGGSFH
jgi:hypothetical protein